MSTGKPEHAGSEWDHSSDDNFYDYYSRESLSESTLERFNSVRERVYRLIEQQGRKPSELDVLDIGCGAGTQCRIWAAEGHRVNGLDVNAPLIGLARERAQEAGLAIRFEVGSATSLPYANESMDVCLMPELLEHVADWESCLREAVRVLRPGGVLFLSTSNVLCPKQHEFELPLYSWYPGFLKRRCEQLAVTTRPELANHARYPAVNWFSYYGLKAWLARAGVRCHDRLDMMDTSAMKTFRRFSVNVIRAVPPLRFILHVLQPGTIVFGVKRPQAS